MTFRAWVLIPVIGIFLLSSCASEDGGPDESGQDTAETVAHPEGATAEGKTTDEARDPYPDLRIENLPEDVRAEIRNADRPILVYFFAPWHQTSEELATDVAKLIPDVRVMQINVDERPNVVEAFGVEGVPALYLLEEARVVDAIPKGMTADSLTDFVEQNIEEDDSSGRIRGGGN